MPRRPLPALALALALGGAAGASEPASAPADGAGARVAVVTTAGAVEGPVRAGRLTLVTPAGPLALRLDRDTAIFLPDRVGTVRDLLEGAQVRAAYGPGHLAYWIEVGAPRRPAGRDEAPPAGPEPVRLPPPAGAAGEAPASPTPAAAEPGGAGAPGQAVPAGPPSPEPNPGAQPPRPGGGGPTPPAGPLRGP